MSAVRPAEAIQIILDNPDLFPSVKRDLDRYGRAMLKKQTKNSRSAKAARALTGAIGEELLAIALEQFSMNEVNVLTRKLDKHNTGFRTLSALDQRQHLKFLFTGEEMPAKATEKSLRSTSEPTPKEDAPKTPLTEAQKIFGHKSMGARRKSKSGRAATS